MNHIIRTLLNNFWLRPKGHSQGYQVEVYLKARFTCEKPFFIQTMK